MRALVLVQFSKAKQRDSATRNMTNLRIYGVGSLESDYRVQYHTMKAACFRQAALLAVSRKAIALSSWSVSTVNVCPSRVADIAVNMPEHPPASLSLTRRSSSTSG